MLERSTSEAERAAENLPRSGDQVVFLMIRHVLQTVGLVEGASKSKS